jgi:hypothetical protein
MQSNNEAGQNHTVDVDWAKSSQGGYNYIPRTLKHEWRPSVVATTNDLHFPIAFSDTLVGHVAHWLKPQIYSFKVNHTVGSDILVCIHAYPSYFIKCWDHVKKSFKENL